MLWKGKLSVFKVDNYLGHWRKLYWALCYRWQWGNLSVERFSPHPFQRLLPLMLRIASLQVTFFCLWQFLHVSIVD